MWVLVPVCGSVSVGSTLDSEKLLFRKQVIPLMCDRQTGQSVGQGFESQPKQREGPRAGSYL